LPKQPEVENEKTRATHRTKLGQRMYLRHIVYI
jgi:hypothetical protein